MAPTKTGKDGNGRFGERQGSGRLRLCDLDPHLTRFLSDHERAVADQFALPVETVRSDDADVEALVRATKSFGVLVVDGMLVHRVRISDRPALRLLGPGDAFWLGDEPSTTLLSESRCSAIAGSKLALIGGNFLLAAHHLPRLVQGLFARAAEQSERAAAHLAIGELPQVDQRLMAMMWLLAENWGYVTPAGTVLPLALTHETLGALIGSRRPTVTLALRDLSARGELIRQDTGWLITGPAPHPDHPMSKLDAPGLLNAPASQQANEQQQVPDVHDVQAAVCERAASLREENQRERQRTSEQRLTMTLRLRRCHQLRQQMASRCTP